jgi:hypothetical protein
VPAPLRDQDVDQASPVRPAGHLAALCAGKDAGASAGARVAPITNDVANTMARAAK